MIQNLFLRSPSQNRTVSEPKTYGFRPKNVRFWDGNHKRMPSEPVIQPKRTGQCFRAFSKNQCQS